MAYLSLSTANLPDPAIDPAAGKEPADYFNTVLYTGDGVAIGSGGHSITGVGFQPDWVWIKRRDASGDHAIFDAVRGAEERLRSNGTDAELNQPATLSTFDSDGFTLGDGTQVNGNGATFASWNWKANGSGVSNTDGSITSTVSANTTSGVSICGYTGTNANETFGHGLNQAPEVVIIKRRSAARDWVIRHPDLSDPDAYHLRFDTGAEYAATDVFRSGTNATVVSIGANSRVSALGDTYIAYCFHSVEGFSKCSSYVGNGSTDGPFVYTGFRPAFIIYKAASTTGNWKMHDVARGTYNANHPELLAESSAAEAGSTGLFDILSNGFKLRTTSQNYNQSGVTYIYMAFAENPFKYSNAR